MLEHLPLLLSTARGTLAYLPLAWSPLMDSRGSGGAQDERGLSQQSNYCQLFARDRAWLLLPEKLWLSFQAVAFCLRKVGPR